MSITMADIAAKAKAAAIDAVRTQAQAELEMIARAFLAEDYDTAEARLPYLRKRLETLRENRV